MLCLFREPKTEDGRDHIEAGVLLPFCIVYTDKKISITAFNKHLFNLEKLKLIHTCVILNNYNKRVRVISLTPLGEYVGEQIEAEEK